MKRALLLVTALSWMVGCGGDDEERLTAEIDGIVYLNGPVAGATVKLRRLTGARLVEASTTADAEGRYRLSGLGALGDMQLEVDVSGLPWTTADGERGTYPDGVLLRSPAPDVDVPQRRRAHVTALTTLLVAVADARAGGAPDPAPLAVVDDFARWLTLDPISTPFDAAPDGVPLGRRHALLLEAFVELAASAADQAGVPPHGVISAPELLNALIADAAGGMPAAFFDGRGADGALSLEAGPGRYDLSESTLRSSYAAAVRRVLATERWADVPDREVADLLASLSCGSAPMFGACIGGQPTDTTVPVISGVEPEVETPLVGAVEITVRADDPESGIASLTLSLSADGAEPLADLDDQPSVARVRLDTAALGGPRLELVARAENRAGLVAEQRLGFPLANVSPGVVEGVVVKGPASWLRVSAYGVRSDGSTVLVGSGRTDEAGDFGFAVEGWRGPLLVRAQGDPTHPDGASGYIDEARWTTLPWDADQSLSALVPAFDPEQPSAPIIVTPLTDLAWARALSQGAPLLDNHADAAALLAAHFALPSGEALRTLLPADPNTPTMAPGDAHRYLFALGCLARQALDVAETLAPDAPETFTALDLVAWYRADLAADGEIDGAAGNEALPLEHEGRPLTLEDPFRADLAASCARWLADAANPSGLTRPQLTESLRAIANDTGALFDPAHAPTPFDVDGPSVEATLEPVGEGTTAGLRTNGAARLTLTLRDAAGIVDARVEAPEGLTVTVERALDLSTTPSEVRWVALVEPDALPDGPLPFAVHADDALGNRRAQTVVVVKDTTPPSLTVSASDGVDTTYEFAWYTQLEQFEAGFEVEDAGPWRIVEQTWHVFDQGGEPLPFPDGLRVIDETHLSLSCPEERRYRLALHVEDDLGNRLRFEPYVRADRSPPSLEWLTLSHVDELNFDHRGRRQDGQPVTRRGRDAIEGSLVRKWQTRWGPDDPNPAVLRVKGVPGGVVESPVVGLAWRAALHGRFGAWRELTLDPNRTGEADVVLDAAGLGFDPIGNPPGPGTRPEIQVRVTDRAGNTFEDSIRLELAVIPPALEIEWLDDYRVDGYVRLDEVSLEDESFGRIWEGGGGLGVLVGGLRVRNPHGVDVRLFGLNLGSIQAEVASTPWMLDQSGAFLAVRRVLPDGTPIVGEGDIPPFVPDGDCGDPPFEEAFYRDLDFDNPRASLGRIFINIPGTCVSARPAIRASALVDAPLGLMTADGAPLRELWVPSGAGSTIGLSTAALPVPLSIRELVAPGVLQLPWAIDRYRYVSLLEQVPGAMFVGDESHCTTCFPAEQDCMPTCQLRFSWFGHRVTIVTDVRIGAIAGQREVRLAVATESGVAGRPSLVAIPLRRAGRVPTDQALP